MELAELEKKYEELGKEIERLKKAPVGFNGDPIFLLSIDEYEKYENDIPIIKEWWWLRSPGDCQNHAALVLNIGSVYYRGDYVFDDENVVVRPALKISNLKSVNLKFVKDGYLVYCGITWKKIGNDLYIAENPIACRRFDVISNDYESSEIRQFLRIWHEERKNW